ncbi:MAG TPA: acyl-CoA dehydrogenase, partial [Burkholderiaceae bacterium]
GAAAPVPARAAVDEDFRREIVPDPVLLFRYSALTFNGHRIHYDRSYVTEVEGYPGLIVHGPLIATLLVDLLRRERPDARLRAFEFKAASPLFDIHPFTLCGRRVDTREVALWARNAQGELAMQARAEID